MSDWKFTQSGDEAINEAKNASRTGDQEAPSTRPTVTRTDGGDQDYPRATRFLGRKR